MELKLPKLTPQDAIEYGGFVAVFLFSTLKTISDYFLFNFPITQVNNYLYSAVLMITIAVGLKRIYHWFRKKKKNGTDQTEI